MGWKELDGVEGGETIIVTYYMLAEAIFNEIKNNNFTSLTLFPFNFNCSYADIQLIGRIY